MVVVPCSATGLKFYELRQSTSHWQKVACISLVWPGVLAQVPTIPFNMSSMDIDLPLEDVIKNSRAQKKSGPKKPPANQKRVQPKKNGQSLGPKKTGKINKSFTTKGTGRVGAIGGQKPKNTVQNSMFNRSGITTVCL